ncbi:hypothetical protein A2V71_03500 [Candidatus Berkelbacteria bacterium RBG_13_40_8]|uniref:Glycosyltransferase 2-like domain-containing protein n=1 Tax=Candidatus Berkelbacteria bacterium RBG_13_40_8 TaxID=1797467 RepID=A0A1F5DNQ3_9BACT|nr:MAG: hypothetical protein A2V71_03500 [Candidatus Berkelbacteria bacterium RBG_13_40_8]
MKLGILIPAYNEEKMLGKVLKTLPKKLPGIKRKEIIVIDDGSSDNTNKIACALDVTVICHYLNRGLGGALGTGFEYAKENDFDVLLTFDADGQHNPADIASVIRPIVLKKADVVVGSRLKNKRGMPWYRRIGIFGLNLITLALFWVWTTDSQSGLRAFSKKAIKEIEIKSNRMEVSSEFFNEIQSHNLKFFEVPITSIYTRYSLSKGQKNVNVFRILSKLIYRRFFAK